MIWGKGAWGLPLILLVLILGSVSGAPSQVVVNGTQLLVNGEPFLARCVGYQPTPIGENVEWGYNIFDHPELWQRDFPLLREMGANSVRTWGKVSNPQFLTDAWNSGYKPIYVIMGYWMNPTDDYGDPTVRAGYINDFRDYVSAYKNYPAVLMWAIGNEDNVHYAGNVSDWYYLANKMAEAAQQEDSNHPVIIVNGGIGNIGNAGIGTDDASLNHIDAWGANVYTGYSFWGTFNDFASRSSRPLIITEYGADAYHTNDRFNPSDGYEDQATQADWDVHLWKEIEGNASYVTLGGCVMAYSDEWWKSGNPSVHDPDGYYPWWDPNVFPDSFGNEEWWGIMAVEEGSSPDVMNPRLAYHALGAQFQDEFVWANGTQFYLNGEPFYFSGTNNYYLWYGNFTCGVYDKNQGCATEVLDDAKAMNLSVIRTWGFSNEWEKHGYVFQPSPGVYDERTFAHFDRVVKEAGDRGLKLMVALVNNWNNFGGMCTYVKWCNVTDWNKCHPDTGRAIHDTFFTNNCTRQLYKDYVSYFLNRVNTLTGVRYKDDPTIFAWELANEPRARSDNTGATANVWVAEMSAFVKSIDSNHMVTAGEDGFYSNPQNCFGRWTHDGSEGQDYIRDHQLPDVDFAGLHMYEWDAFFDYPGLLEWIDEHIYDGHYVVGKPVVLKEFGKKEPGRDSYMSGFYQEIEDTAMNGDIFWMLCDDNYSDMDGFCIYYPGDSTVGVITDHANAMMAKKTNQGPSLGFMPGITVDETQVVEIVVNATDPDNKVLAYYINDSRFEQYGSTFRWQTYFNDTGFYTVRITVSDSLVNVSQDVDITVLDIAIVCDLPVDGETITSDKSLCPYHYRFSSGLTIGADGITLDCNWAVLEGDWTTTAVYAYGRDNVTIQNCTIKNFTNGIHVELAIGSLIQNNRLISNRYGILLEDMELSRVYGNVLEENDVGIYLGPAWHSRIHGNKANLNIVGLFLSYGSYENEIYDENYDRNCQVGIFTKGSKNNTLWNISANNNKKYGAYLDYHTVNTSIFNSSFNSNGWVGIQIYASTNNTLVMYSNITGNDKGFYISSSCNNTTLVHNNIDNHDWNIQNGLFIYNTVAEYNWWGTTNAGEIEDKFVDCRDWPQYTCVDYEPYLCEECPTGWTSPCIRGDVDGNCVVDIFDLAAVGLAYGSSPGSPNWNPDADVTGDDTVNIFDLATVGLNYGSTC